MGLCIYEEAFSFRTVLAPERSFCPVEEYINCLSSAKQSVLKTYIQLTLYGLHRLALQITYLYVYTNTYMPTVTINEKKKP